MLSRLRRWARFGKSTADQTENSPPVATATIAEPPETADERVRLQSFIEDFLTPIAADRKLDLKNEDTPLLAAYYAYDIHELLVRDKDDVEAKFREAILAAGSRGDYPSMANDLVDAWNRVSQRSKRISKAEYEKLRAWFREQAAKPRLDYPFNEQPSDSAFGADSINPQAITTFCRLFREIFPTSDDDEADVASPQPINTTTADSVKIIEFPESFLEKIRLAIKTAKFDSRENDILRAVKPLLSGDKPPGMVFDKCRTSWRNRAVVVSRDELPDDSNLWFLGDLHGDLLTLECALSYIQDFVHARPWKLVLLGDLFDRGGNGYEVLLRVFDLIVKKPSQIALLTGNHDEALDGSGTMFTSTVSPSDFTDWLNQHADDPWKRQAGELAIEYFKNAPRAFFLPDGLLLAHGGVPHSGRWNDIKRRDDFDEPPCLQDFVWNRAHERARTRIPSDVSRGCEFGYEDFTNFCKLATKVIGQPVERMVRGHDHVEERFLRYAKYVDNPILTINGMSRRLTDEMFGPYVRVPCVARWVSGQLPEVHRLKIPPEMIREVYPEPQES